MQMAISAFASRTRSETMTGMYALLVANADRIQLNAAAWESGGANGQIFRHRERATMKVTEENARRGRWCCCESRTCA
jgi:hypothetical protein